ncbi:hypothetical protein B0H11DRAFT_2076465 [Mycena galericulata]|nr:hypothetical protein B0H11DRAFT_2087946 [Mycena galericulata]KAJ7450928.1 hypothetical protein B0H11DRAFT_2076465 [Mycena galericulata]
MHLSVLFQLLQLSTSASPSPTRIRRGLTPHVNPPQCVQSDSCLYIPQLTWLWNDSMAEGPRLLRLKSSVNSRRCPFDSGSSLTKAIDF